MSFRLPLEAAATLTEQAEAHGLSSGKYARELVLRALDSPAGPSSSDAITRVQRAIDALREDLATAVLGILTETNRVLPEDRRLDADEIRTWITDSLMQPS